MVYSDVDGSPEHRQKVMEWQKMANLTEPHEDVNAAREKVWNFWKEEDIREEARRILKKRRRLKRNAEDEGDASEEQEKDDLPPELLKEVAEKMADGFAGINEKIGTSQRASLPIGGSNMSLVCRLLRRRNLHYEATRNLWKSILDPR